jgi:hypothetical protein
MEERSNTGASASGVLVETWRGVGSGGGEGRRVRVDLRRASTQGTRRPARPTPYAADSSDAGPGHWERTWGTSRV